MTIAGQGLKVKKLVKVTGVRGWGRVGNDATAVGLRRQFVFQSQLLVVTGKHTALS